jgi:hypothetical protein
MCGVAARRPTSGGDRAATVRPPAALKPPRPPCRPGDMTDRRSVRHKVAMSPKAAEGGRACWRRYFRPQGGMTRSVSRTGRRKYLYIGL